MHLKKFDLFGLFFGCFVFVNVIQSGMAIMCHNCSSVDDSSCMDPFDKASQKFLVNCSAIYDMQREDQLPKDKPPHLCRKIDQTVNGVHRILRYCAWEEHKNRDCYLGATEYYKGKICICREDGCNRAPSFVSAHPVIITATVAFVLGCVSMPFL